MNDYCPHLQNMCLFEELFLLSNCICIKLCYSHCYFCQQKSTATHSAWSLHWRNRQDDFQYVYMISIYISTWVEHDCNGSYTWLNLLFIHSRLAQYKADHIRAIPSEILRRGGGETKNKDGEGSRTKNMWGGVGEIFPSAPLRISNGTALTSTWLYSLVDFEISFIKRAIREYSMNTVGWWLRRVFSLCVLYVLGT